MVKLKSTFEKAVEQKEREGKITRLSVETSREIDRAVSKALSSRGRSRFDYPRGC
jgi:hypothetical protein